jgi:osomolarity two-component system response regulator SSK1
MVRFSLLRPFFRRKQSAPATLHSHTDDTDTISLASTTANSAYSADPTASASSHRTRRRASSLDKSRGRAKGAAEIPEPVPEVRESLLLTSDPVKVDEDDEKSPQISTDELPTPSSSAERPGSETLAGEGERRPKPSTPDTTGSPSAVAEETYESTNGEGVNIPPILVVQQPTPDAEEVLNPSLTTTLRTPSPLFQQQSAAQDPIEATLSNSEPPRKTSSQISPGHASVEGLVDRRQSIINSANAKIVETLVDAPVLKDPLASDTTESLALPSAVLDLFTPGLPNMANMLQRKIWVQRPGGSATLVQIKEDDLVDDVRDMILKKYANSLGKTFDSPDMLLRIVSRGDHGQPRTDRVLGPEEPMCRTIDVYYPGGQNVDDALVIDVPPKRTPRPSPRYHHYQGYPIMDDQRPVESGTEYFPPMPAIVHPAMPHTAGSHDSRPSVHSDHHRSISVLNTGQIPLLPSPGGARRHLERGHRPRFNRQQTSSPTILQHHPTNASAVAIAANNNLAPQQQAATHRGSLRPRTESTSSEHPHPHLPNGVSAPQQPMPTPPAAENAAPGSNPATPSTAQPTHQQRPSRPKKSSRKPLSGSRYRKDRNGNSQSPQPTGISSMLDASIPPINVLIVEDNIINLRILEGLMKRLKVRWETAMNGQIAVDKWRGGGFHLVLMDIQMPVMNGLAATKEIRRLEKVNGIGVFSSSPVEQRKLNGGSNPESNDEAEDAAEIKRKRSADKLPEATGGIFKSPIIIVALTASSLQSDRHEALAAGCNDFLTKPVNFVWLERKVKEWGCMQALIDFDGWRRWKDYASKEEAGKTEEQKREEKEKDEKQKRKMEKLAILQEKQRVKKEAEEAKKKADREKAEREAPAEDADGKDSTAAEVAKEKAEIDLGDKAHQQAEANPGPDAEPPALVPETIAEE